MDFVPLAAALALIWKIVDFAKQVRAKDVNGSITQLVTWAAGIGVTFVLANSDFGDGVPLAGSHLGSLNVWSLVLVGLTISSTGSVLYDYKKAVDKSDSAVMPLLVTGKVPPKVIDPPAGHTTATKQSPARTRSRTS